MSILLIAVAGTLCCLLCSGTWSSIPRRQERLSSQEWSRCVSGSPMHNPQDGFSLYSSFSRRQSLLEPWLGLTTHPKYICGRKYGESGSAQIHKARDCLWTRAGCGSWRQDLLRHVNHQGIVSALLLFPCQPTPEMKWWPGGEGGHGSHSWSLTGTVLTPG